MKTLLFHLQQYNVIVTSINDSIMTKSFLFFSLLSSRFSGTNKLEFLNNLYSSRVSYARSFEDKSNIFSIHL